MDKDYILFFLGAGLSGAIAFLVYLFKQQQGIKDSINNLSSRLVKLEIVWSLAGKQIAKALHSPHTPDLDALLEKYDRDELDRDELALLIDKLNTLTTNSTATTGERAAAGLLLAFIEQKYGLQSVST